MKKLGIGCLSFIVIVIITIVTIVMVRDHRLDKTIQTEVQAVVAAFENSSTNTAESLAMDAGTNVATADNRPDKVYPMDLEKTIRIFHILDEGLSKSHSMHDYLKFLATQDYRGVPKEVLEAKKKLIPYYVSIRKAEEDLDEAEGRQLWKSVLQFENLTSENSPLGAAILAAANGMFSPSAIHNLTMQGIATGKEVFENIKKNEDFVKEAKKALENNQEVYIEYLSEYTALYVKYMMEWNQLCLSRDNAYIAIHNGDYGGALRKLNELLQKYPNDRESMILKAYSLLMQKITNPIAAEIHNDIGEVEALLNAYIAQNPDRSAPALVLLGTYNMLKGDEQTAKNLYDQSAVEYPRQAEELLDMYNSYSYRNYMLKSVEGKFVQEMYKSMMEGYGFFSPNFQKAMLAYDKGDYARSKEEVFRHFFRRGNQGVYDYLISDMLFVETHMPKILDMIFEEHSFLDLQAYNPTMSFSDKLAIEIENRSDKRLSNVRLFICLHLTDMYKDEYVVKKMETSINNIEPHSKADFGKLQMDFELYGKKKNRFDDIVSARAIILTDSLIIWVDQDKVKKSSIRERLRNKNTSRQMFENTKGIVFANTSISGKEIVDALNARVSFEMKKKDGLGGIIGGKNIVFHFPRSLDAIKPYFSFGKISQREAIYPVSVVLNGNSIDVEFEKNNDFASKKEALYISSKYGDLFLDVTFDDNAEPKEISKVLFQH